MGVVVLSSVAGGIGLAGGQGADLIVGTLGTLLGLVHLGCPRHQGLRAAPDALRCGGVAPDASASSSDTRLLTRISSATLEKALAEIADA